VAERLTLREPRARDRAAAIELFASPEVGIYTGGAEQWLGRWSPPPVR
jgi:RimJ/RimL family protein N-acetyltransferase